MNKYLLIDKGDGSWWYEYRDGVCVTNEGEAFSPQDHNVIDEDVVSQKEDLDWDKTCLDQPDSDTGWLDREGRWYGCLPGKHSLYARYVLRTTEPQLIDMGWIKVGMRMINSRPTWIAEKHPSAGQRNWLSKHGYNVE